MTVLAAKADSGQFRSFFLFFRGCIRMRFELLCADILTCAYTRCFGGIAILCCRYKRFELVALRGALKTVLERWADALDPGTSIPHQYTALASTLDEQCSHFLDKSQPHSFT